VVTGYGRYLEVLEERAMEEEVSADLRHILTELDYWSGRLAHLLGSGKVKPEQLEDEIQLVTLVAEQVRESFRKIYELRKRALAVRPRPAPFGRKSAEEIQRWKDRMAKREGY